MSFFITLFWYHALHCKLKHLFNILFLEFLFILEIPNYYFYVASVEVRLLFKGGFYSFFCRFDAAIWG